MQTLTPVDKIFMNCSLRHCVVLLSFGNSLSSYIENHDVTNVLLDMDV